MSFLGDLSGSQALANMAGNLAQNSAMNQGTMAAAQQQQNDMAAQQAYLNSIYGPQGFGGQTAAYAGAGAAYGRETGGFGGYGAPNADPFTPVSTAGSDGLYRTANGQIDQSNAENIAAYYRIMSGGYGQPGGYTAPTPALFPTPQQPAPYSDGGGYNPYDPSIYAPSAQKNVGGGTGGIAYLPNGQIDQNNADNIALYYRLMGGNAGFGGQGVGQQFDPATYSGGQGAINAVQKAGTGGFAVGQTPQMPYDNSNPLGNDVSQYTGGIVYLPNGQPDQNNANNIALYYRLMAGGGGGGGSTPWIDAGKQGSNFNPYGLISSGSIGQSDSFGGYQPAPPQPSGGIVYRQMARSTRTTPTTSRCITSS